MIMSYALEVKNQYMSLFTVCVKEPIQRIVPGSGGVNPLATRTSSTSSFSVFPGMFDTVPWFSVVEVPTVIFNASL